MGWANVYIWSSARLERVSRIVNAAFHGISDYFSAWCGHELCDVATFCMPGGKPVFFKVLQNFLKFVGRYGTRNVLLIDDSFYKCHYNPPGSYVIVPGIEDRRSDFLSRDLQEVLAKWRDATDRSAFTFDNARPTSEDNYVKAALQQRGRTTSYQAYMRSPQLFPVSVKH